MIFEEGFVKKYSTLRTQNPSVFYLEDFYYKVLQLSMNENQELYLNNKKLEDSENIITVSFPEFLDVATNLSLIKSIHYKTDIAFSKTGMLTDKDSSSPVKLAHIGQELNNYLENPQSIFYGLKFKDFPEGMINLYFGYRHTPVKDKRSRLDNAESLCCKQLAEMEDSCFTWLSVDDNLGIHTETDKTSVCKFKIELRVDLFKEWFEKTVGFRRYGKWVEGLGYNEVDINFILHPPYIGRMSFKNNLKIVYPLQRSRLKVIDKITFRVNRSFTANNKTYKIAFIDKDTQQTLFSFNSITNSELFSNIKQSIDTSTVNSYFDKEIETFDDAVMVNFEIPNPVQIALSKHRNYKIRIEAKDLTTQERGN